MLDNCSDINELKYTLPRPSDEQDEVIINFIKGFNIRINSVAGAGKTTTLLLLASEAKKTFGLPSLILTYNRDLKDDIVKHIRDIGLQGYCDTYTYHGYASRIYQTGISTDTKLRENLIQPAPFITKHQIILLDEVQDMNCDYHRLVSQILTRGKLLVIVGDKKQCINDYLGASSEYLLNYEKYFDTGRPWKELSLRTSYRLTPCIADFVNTHILNDDIIIGGNTRNSDIKPIYSYGLWNMSTLIKEMVDKYGSKDVVIMMPSVRNINEKSPVGAMLRNKNHGLLFCVRDEANISDEMTQNKVIITSYNSMKGREAKCVVVIGFDESYLEYYHKSWPKEEQTLPNIIYVIATRAKESLIVIHDESRPMLRTINRTQLYRTCFVKGGKTEEKPMTTQKDKRWNVTDVIRHRNTTDTMELLSMIKVKTITEPGPIINYQNIIQFNGYFEDMKSYYGVLIPLYAEYVLTGKTYLYDDESDLEAILNKFKDKKEEIIERYEILLQITNKSLKEWMELVVLHCAIQSRWYFYAYQIVHYDWVDENFINIMSDRLIEAIPLSGHFEQDIVHNGAMLSTIKDGKESRMGIIKYQLEGIIDYITETEMWEFKCSNGLSDEHIIQCAAYIAIYSIQTSKLLPCKLFNLRSGEIVEVVIEKPRAFLDVLIKHKLQQ